MVYWAGIASKGTLGCGGLTPEAVWVRHGTNMSPLVRRAFDRLAHAQIQLSEQVGLITAQNQLPAMPSTARKSQKQVDKFGALTTKDANRQMAKRKNKEYEANVRKAERTALLGLASTSMRALEGEENVLLTPTDMAQAANHYYHPSYPR